jgi:hypothetical protein
MVLEFCSAHAVDDPALMELMFAMMLGEGEDRFVVVPSPS